MAKTRNEARLLRMKRIRKRIRGTGEQPRLSVFRSNKHIYAQIIDDVAGRTLAAASTLGAGPSTEGKSDLEGAATVGKVIAEKATASGITKVVFDRAGYKYHGRIKALADAAREAGLQF